MMKKIKRSAGAREINWSELHRKNEAMIEGLERGITRRAEEKNKILHDRALKYAKSDSTVVDDSELLELVVFSLAYETYAIESSFVVEVYPLTEIVPVPNAPDFVLGIINVRGKIVSVVELKKFFELPQKGITELNKVIILRNSEMEFGILADAVHGSRSVYSSTLQKSLPTLTGLREQYLKGINSEPLVVLDAGKLLSDPKMLVGGTKAKYN